MVSITNSDVQEVYGQQDVSLNSTKQDSLRTIAENLTEDVFGGRVSRQSEIEGNEEDFTKYLAAHLWTLAERKALNDEFQTGYSDGVDSFRADPETALSGTQYGNVCLLYLRDRASIGIVRADR